LRFCPNCGASSSSEDTFCSKCGTKLRTPLKQRDDANKLVVTPTKKQPILPRTRTLDSRIPIMRKTAVFFVVVALIVLAASFVSHLNNSSGSSQAFIDGWNYEVPQGSATFNAGERPIAACLSDYTWSGTNDDPTQWQDGCVAALTTLEGKMNSDSNPNSWFISRK